MKKIIRSRITLEAMMRQNEDMVQSMRQKIGPGIETWSLAYHGHNEIELRLLVEPCNIEEIKYEHTTTNRRVAGVV